MARMEPDEDEGQTFTWPLLGALYGSLVIVAVIAVLRSQIGRERLRVEPRALTIERGEGLAYRGGLADSFGGSLRAFIERAGRGDHGRRGAGLDPAHLDAVREEVLDPAGQVREPLLIHDERGALEPVRLDAEPLDPVGVLLTRGGEGLDAGDDRGAAAVRLGRQHPEELRVPHALSSTRFRAGWG